MTVSTPAIASQHAPVRETEREIDGQSVHLSSALHF